MFGFNCDELRVDFAVCDVLAVVLRNLCRRSNRKGSHHIRIDLFHCKSNRFVAAHPISLHLYFLHGDGSKTAYFGADGFEYKSFPTRFWDIFGEFGIPVRVTISEMGPTLLSRLLGLTDVQTGVLNIVFKVADEQGLLLLDLKDLRAMLQYVGENRVEFTTSYGNVSAASIGAIQRALLAFESEGGEQFFGEPELDITNFLRTDMNGRGYINILEIQ